MEEPAVSDEENINKLQSTVELLVFDDKKELLDLIKGFRDKVDKDFTNVVYKRW